MAGRYHDVPISQDELVKRVEDARLVPRSECGDDPDAIEFYELISIDGVQADPAKDRALLTDTLDLSEGAQPLVDAIAAGKPVIVVMQPSEGAGHAYLAYGASAVRVGEETVLVSLTVVDPRLPHATLDESLSCSALVDNLIAAIAITSGTKADAQARRKRLQRYRTDTSL
jgi:hypothetical protein